MLKIYQNLIITLKDIDKLKLNFENKILIKINNLKIYIYKIKINLIKFENKLLIKINIFKKYIIIKLK